MTLDPLPSLPLPSLPDTLLKTVRRYGLFAQGERVVVAVSGGPNSTALLHVLIGLRVELGIELVAAHLNHGIRGEEAEGDAAYVAALCERLGVEAQIGHADVPQIRKRLHRSAQETARKVRHEWLRRVAHEVGASRIALGHTRDDRIETILLNLLRGTGAEGLSGFPPRDGPLVRPLYEVGREEVLAYCAVHTPDFRFDSSNAHLDYLRNRTRAELLPYLRSYYNSGVDSTLLRMAELISADNEALEHGAAELFERSNLSSRKDEAAFKCDVLLEMLPAFRRRVLRRAISLVRGSLEGVTFEMVERALEAVAEGSNCSITLPTAGRPTVRMLCDGISVRVVREAPPTDPVPWQVELKTPGITHLLGNSSYLETSICADHQALKRFYDASGAPAGKALRLAVPLSEVALPLLARSRRPGDRIQLSGGSKKLQDLFVDRRIPAHERAFIPVICDSTGCVLAVIGVAVSAQAWEPEGLIGINDPSRGWIALTLSKVAVSSAGVL